MGIIIDLEFLRLFSEVKDHISIWVIGDDVADME